MIEFYRVDLVNDETGETRSLFVQAKSNPVATLVKVDDMRVFWSARLSCEQYESQKKEAKA